MSKLNKAQRKKAYISVRNRIIEGRNIMFEDELGKLGVCEMLSEYVGQHHTELCIGEVDDKLKYFPEFLEERPVGCTGKYSFWWDEDNDQLRIDALNRCIDKLKPIKK